mmetsp:Transcript_45433/g.101949  ORF Transcript_45433/g.101949 Transcript_45433/m.101949 type:complete len:324 (+) Transcript_45433:126-1097(+)
MPGMSRGLHETVAAAFALPTKGPIDLRWIASTSPHACTSEPAVLVPSGLRHVRRSHFFTSFGGSMPDMSGLPMGEVRGQAGGNLPPDKSGKPMKLSNSETDETRAAGDKGRKAAQEAEARRKEAAEQARKVQTKPASETTMGKTAAGLEGEMKGMLGNLGIGAGGTGSSSGGGGTNASEAQEVAQLRQLCVAILASQEQDVFLRPCIRFLEKLMMSRDAEPVVQHPQEVIESTLMNFHKWPRMLGELMWRLFTACIERHGTLLSQVVSTTSIPCIAILPEAERALAMKCLLGLRGPKLKAFLVDLGCIARRETDIDVLHRYTV